MILIMKKELPKIVVILGPTASGKTKLAVKLANNFNGEIISADSRQVYKGMDIGSGKDIKEYGQIKYHLIDVTSPKQIFSLAKFQRLADKAIKDILKRNKLPILCGGTGLYAEAVFDGYVIPKIKPDLALRKELEKLSIEQLQSMASKLKREFNNSDWNNPVRLIRSLEKNNDVEIVLKKEKYAPIIFAVKTDQKKLKNNITKRLNSRLKEGLIEEIKKLHEDGISWQRLESFGLEYKIVSLYLQNKINLAEMKNNIINDSLKYAKRQITWLHRPVLKNRINWIASYNDIKKAL